MMNKEKITTLITKAVATADKGYFVSNAQQQWTLRILNVAYMELRLEVKKQILEKMKPFTNLNDRKLYQDIPSVLYRWKPGKHTRIYNTCHAVEAVELINKLVEMRETYKQMPIQKEQK